MSVERTLQQTDEDLRRAQAKSLEQPADRPRTPPAQVPGYELERFLGEGAFGEVWVAVDCNTGRHVAIKFYNHRGGVDWSLLSREVEKLRFLSADRYVVQLIEVGWESDPPYYVMEYVDQGSLDERLERGPMPAHDAVKLFRELCIGLGHAHGRGVLHCDLKPANILLDQDQRPRLADFGQSRLSHEQKPALGTLFYMAPEQADLSAVPDARWDVYALGAVFYSMLTGQPPHRDEGAISGIDQAENLEDRLARYRRLIETSPRPAVHRQAPGVDRELAEILDRCLEPQPGRRYPNVQAVINALDLRALRGARRPLLVMGALGPALLMLVMSVFAWRGYRGAMQSAEGAVRDGAKESNLFAAQFAAEKAANEIEDYYRAVESVSHNENFQTLVGDVIADKQVVALATKIDELELALTPAEKESVHTRSDLITEIQKAQAEVDEAEENEDEADEDEKDANKVRRSELEASQERLRELEANLTDRVRQLLALHEEFKTIPVRQKLQDWFDRCLADLNNNEPRSEDWRVASSFVLDVGGTSLARAPYADTVGGNFGYRTYHHGEADDKPLAWRPGPDDHITHTHLSTAFRSKATGKWLVAISTPVHQGGPDGEFLGVAVFTVEVPNFMKFQGREDQFAILVDGRPGKNQGLILQHPLLGERDDTEQDFAQHKVPEAMLHPLDLPPGEDPSADSQTESAGPDAYYVDPLVNDPDRKWLTAVHRVVVERVESDGAIHSGEARELIPTYTGLVVIVQEDYNAVFRPVQTLGHRLVSESLWALGFVVFVITLLWGFVILVFNDSSRSRLASVLRRRAGLKTPGGYSTSATGRSG